MHRAEQAIENHRLPKTEVIGGLYAIRDAPGIHAVAGQAGTFYPEWTAGRSDRLGPHLVVYLLKNAIQRKPCRGGIA